MRRAHRTARPSGGRPGSERARARSRGAAARRRSSWRRSWSRARSGAWAPLEPALLVGVSVLHELDDGAVDLDEGHAQEVVAASGRIERVCEYRVTLERAREVVDPVRDVGL